MWGSDRVWGSNKYTYIYSLCELFLHLLNMSLKSKIDTIINDATSTPDGLPGVVIAAVNRDGDVIYEGAAGERQLGSGKPMTVDSVFWIASFTKLVTTICAMQLVEQGKIDLDEPVEKFVPEISKPQILEGFDANGQPILRDAKVKITLRHLLTHTSGHTYDFFNPNHKKWNDENHVPDSFSTEDSVNYAPRAREAGESWEYGLAIDWAGKVVEKISGMRLNDYMQKNIMQPLGLKSTNFNLTPDMRSRMAGMHQRDSSGKLTATDMSINKTAKEYVGGAGLWSCAHDYLTILTVLLNNGKAPKSGAQILKPETVKEMLTPQLKGQVRKD